MRNWLVAAVATVFVPLSALAAGPSGYGPIKLGIAKEAIEALQETDGVYLRSPMTPYEYKNSAPKPGEDKFDAQVITPLSASSLKAVLTFEAGQLTALHLTLDDTASMLEQVKKQIVEKYGPGKTEDNRKEEQCIYKNGANFKLTSGVVSTKWVEPLSGSVRIETSLSDMSIEVCPSNLRYGSLGPIKLKSLSIRKVTAGAEPKAKNLF